MKIRTGKIIVLAAAVLIASVPAPEAVEKAGDVVSVRGPVEIERQTKLSAAAVKAVLFESDSVITRDRGRAKMLFRDDSVLTLGANSRLVIRKYLHSPETKRAESIYELADGKLRAVVGSPGFKVQTPTAFAAARGTVFTATYDPATGVTEISVLEGAVELRNINATVSGSQIVNAGQSSQVSGNRPPTRPKPFDPKSGAAADDTGLPAPGDQGGTGGDQGDTGLKRLGLLPPIVQDPAHAVTRLDLTIGFPR